MEGQGAWRPLPCQGAGLVTIVWWVGFLMAPAPAEGTRRKQKGKRGGGQGERQQWIERETAKRAGGCKKAGKEATGGRRRARRERKISRIVLRGDVGQGSRGAGQGME